MTDEPRAGGARPTVPAAPGRAAGGRGDGRGFLARHRLPLALAVIAVCGYVGSIVYIIYFRGQIG